MNDLKRVGLIFKEDGAADFRKSLQLVNSELSKNYSEFKKTQAQWDDSTKKTEKLKYQIENLTNAYELQSDKVTILKSQLSELENAENQNVTAISKKRAELDKAELKLISYEKQIKDLSNQLKTSGKEITEFGEKITKAGKNVEDAGKKISVASAVVSAALGASVKSAIDFESAFTGVEKTVDATDDELTELKTQIRAMAKEIPSSTIEISAVAEAAGQLGIKTEDIMSFTRVMIDLGNATNLSSDEAATALAKFANVTKMSAEDYDKLGSTIVALGNNFATTERDIVEMSTRLAATGELAGLSQAQILALATSMSSVGIEAEVGGSAMSKLLKQIQVATETGSKKLDKFASVAGMSSKEFKQAFEEDAVSALGKFIAGLNDTERNGMSAISILNNMGITETRLSNTILSLANSSELMNDAISLSGKAWEDNTALTDEANKRYETLESQIQMTLNKISDMGITIGEKLMPSIQKVLDGADKWIKKFENLSEDQVDIIVKIGLLVAAVGPLVTILGKVVSGVGGAVSALGTLKTALEVSKGLTTSTSTAVNGLASVFTALTSPVGIAVAGIVASVALVEKAVNDSVKGVADDFSTMGNAAADFIRGIDTATSHLSDFNSELFASSEEQQELQRQMQEVQNGITSICKTASDERREYTQEEITQLDEYFTRLRELNQREIEIQQMISTAITQQAVTNAETFQGSLEEYKVQSQEWLKTAEEQSTKTIDLINKQTIEEVALLNQRYGDEANMQNEAYATEYNKVMEQKDKKIEQANAEVAKISKVYADGYAERSLQENGFFAKVKSANEKAENENQRHTEKLEEISNGWYYDEQMRKNRISTQEALHSDNMKKIWKEMAKNMSDEEAAELGVWLAKQANTELYGGKIEDENKEIIDNIISAYDSMPPKTREKMSQAMSPMLEEMERSQPILNAKSLSIADGILSNLRKAFDIHSPSRKTRQIMKFAMEPMEEELDNGKKEMFKQAEELGDGLTDRLGDIDSDYNFDGNIRGNYNSNNYESIDYDKISSAFLNALNKCKLSLDSEGFIRIVRNEIYEVL